MGLTFSKREKNIFYGLMLILLGYAVYAVFYQFFWINLSSFKSRISAAEQRLSAERRQRQALSGELKRRASLLEDFRQKESDGSVRTRMLSALQKLSAREGVRISDMKPVNDRVEGSYKEFPVSITLEGGLTDVMRFLFFTESREFGFRIKEFRFSKAYSEGAVLQCQVVLLRTFLTAEHDAK